MAKFKTASKEINCYHFLLHNKEFLCLIIMLLKILRNLSVKFSGSSQVFKHFPFIKNMYFTRRPTYVKYYILFTFIIMVAGFTIIWHTGKTKLRE